MRGEGWGVSWGVSECGVQGWGQGSGVRVQGFRVQVSSGGAPMHIVRTHASRNPARRSNRASAAASNRPT